MNPQELLDLSRRSTSAFNDRDWDRFGELLAPDAVYDEVGTGRKVTGRDDIVAVVRSWPRAFSDLKGTIDHTLASGDRAVCEVTFEGSHDGELQTPLGTVTPSGNSVTTRCAQTFRVNDGRIVEMRNYFDMLQMLTAVDAIPTGAASGAGA